MTQKVQFPKGFLWGASSSAYQTEGGNSTSEWARFEHSKRRMQQFESRGLSPVEFQCGAGVESFSRYDEDFALAQHLGHTATRVSIEWSRIEPREGEFSEEALEHYERVLRSAKFHGLTVFCTLFHFSLPSWFADHGGFARNGNVRLFVRFCQLVTTRLSEYVDLWVTIHEPEMYSGLSYLSGTFPPAVRDRRWAWRVLRNLVLAHHEIAPFIRERCQRPVGASFHLAHVQAANPLAWPAASLVRYINNRYAVEHIAPVSDFIGVNYYTRHLVGPLGGTKTGDGQHSDAGWEVHPKGLLQVLLELKKHGIPIYITENGLADRGDHHRKKFIEDHLYYTSLALDQGVDIRGYLHYSMTDCFEWVDGWTQAYGLVAVDREDNYRRRVRPSAVAYSEIIKNNSFTHEI